MPKSKTKKIEDVGVLPSITQFDLDCAIENLDSKMQVRLDEKKTPQLLEEKMKIDNAIMRVCKVSEIKHVLAHTDKGDFCLSLTKGGLEYRFILDAVPVSDEDNKKLLEMFNGYLYSI